MRRLEARELLDAWEAGLDRAPLQQALILLAAALPDAGPDSLVTLSVGQRDRRLLQLREALFGTRLANTAVCPDCGERIEWENRTSEFLAEAGARAWADVDFNLESGEYALRFRLPNSLDLADVTSLPGHEDAERNLLERCLLDARRGGETCEFGDLPETVVGELSENIALLDEQADLQIALRCPACSHDWVVLFDIASFLWKEVNEWAGRMLQTVCRLALAYGWSEREILGLSPARRQLYLGMLGR